MATLAQWNMGQAAAQTVAEGVSVNDLANGQGLPNWNVNATWGYSTDPTLQAGPLAGATQAITAPYEANAVAVGSYWEITITPEAGATMSLSLLTALWARGNTTGSRGSALRGSHDGYSATLWWANAGNVRPNWAPANSPNVDLSGIAAFQNTPNPAIFRFYVWGADGTRVCDFDSLTIEGTVVLPSGGAVTYRPWLITGGRMR